MNSPVEQYRELASKARELAASSNLPRVKLRYLRSAQHFDELMAGLENIAQAKVRNEAARAESRGLNLGAVCGLRPVRNSTRFREKMPPGSTLRRAGN